MKKLFFRVPFIVILMILITFSCSQESTLDPIPTNSEAESLKSISAKANVKSTVAIISPIAGTNITGTSTLHRSKNGITVNFKANGLIPGAYTIWWVIWNKPQQCGIPGECTDTDFGNAANVEVEVMYAAGHVVGNNGKGNFSAHLNVDDDSGSINEAFFGLPPAGGLQAGNTLSAEVHVVLRTHGPVVPGVVNEQIGSYGGGCDDPLMYAPFTVYPNVIGECGDIAFAIHSPVN